MAGPSATDPEHRDEIDRERAGFVARITPYAMQLSTQGWLVDLRPDIFGVIGFTKNGKPMSGHRVRIQYCEIEDKRSADVRMQFPWRVKSRKLMSDAYFDRLEMAIQAFQKRLSASAPVRP